MYERMLDKNNKPTLSQIKEHLGEDSYILLCTFENKLLEQYHLSKEIRFPFGNNYGWGYKFSHNSVHLCYAFFEQGAFTVTVQVGDKQVSKVEEIMNSLSPKAKELWANRYPCGENGGWIHFRALCNTDLIDILKFVNAKKSPIKIK